MLRAFKGHCSFRMYMPNKPAKYGIKIFIMADAKTSYMWDAIVYLGKNKDNERAHNISQNIVLDLTKPIKGSGRNVTTDNWFTSERLADELLLNNLTIVGTIRMNKPEVPKELKILTP